MATTWPGHRRAFKLRTLVVLSDRLGQSTPSVGGFWFEFFIEMNEVQVGGRRRPCAPQLSACWQLRTCFRPWTRQRIRVRTFSNSPAADGSRSIPFRTASLVGPSSTFCATNWPPSSEVSLRRVRFVCDETTDEIFDGIWTFWNVWTGALDGC